jgi:hypothetical protein
MLQYSFIADRTYIIYAVPLSFTNLSCFFMLFTQFFFILLVHYTLSLYSFLASFLWILLHIFNNYYKQEVNSNFDLKISLNTIFFLKSSFLWYMFTLEWKEASTQSRTWLWLEQTQWNTGEHTDLNTYSLFS